MTFKLISWNNSKRKNWKLSTELCSSWKLLLFIVEFIYSQTYDGKWCELSYKWHRQSIYFNMSETLKAFSIDKSFFHFQISRGISLKLWCCMIPSPAINLDEYSCENNKKHFEIMKLSGFSMQKLNRCQQILEKKFNFCSNAA